METFKSVNGLTMLRCKPLNFQVEHKYRDNTGPLHYFISCGGMTEAHICLYKPEDNKLTISNMAYSSDETLSFYCTTFEQASLIVYSFGIGNYNKDIFNDTIYVD